MRTPRIARGTLARATARARGPLPARSEASTAGRTPTRPAGEHQGNLPRLITTDLDGPNGTPPITTTFRYSSSNQRVQKSYNGTVQNYFAELYERTEDSGTGETLHKYFVAAGGKKVAQLDRLAVGGLLVDERTQYIHADFQGSSTAITGTTITGQADVTRQKFTPFGKPEQQSYGITPGFTGFEHDEDLGLTNARGRMYDPLIGRFASADPIVQSPSSRQSLNRYTYTRNNPINLVDPSGFLYVSCTPEEVASGACDARLSATNYWAAFFTRAQHYRETGTHLAAVNWRGMFGSQRDWWNSSRFLMTTVRNDPALLPFWAAQGFREAAKAIDQKVQDYFDVEQPQPVPPEGGPRDAQTPLTISENVNVEYDKEGRISKAEVSLDVSVETEYFGEATPEWNSGYGRGTTTQDRSNPEWRTLGFHELMHQVDLYRYVSNHPIPPLVIEIGYTRQQVNRAMADWSRARDVYQFYAHLDTILRTDCLLGTSPGGTKRAGCP